LQVPVVLRLQRRVSALNLLWFVASLGLFVALIVYVGPPRVASTIGRAEPLTLAAAFGCYALFFVLRGIRWTMILRPIAPQLDAGQAAAVTAGGWMISSFVPFKAGDMARVALVARRHRVGLVAVGGTVAIERALDIIGLAVAATIGLLLAAFVAESMPDTVAKAVVVAWVLPLLGLLALFLFARWVPARDHENFVMRFAHRFLTAARALRENPRRLPGLLALSVVTTASQVGIFVFLFEALRPGSAWIPILAGAPLFLLSFVVAVTPGQVGTYEAAFVAVFLLMGFPRADLLPMAVACHLLSATFVATLGTLGFLSFRVHQPASEPGPVLEPRREAEVDA
jgi:uncharacterized protein (TIRG00374 family)